MDIKLEHLRTVMNVIYAGVSFIDHQHVGAVRAVVRLLRFNDFHLEEQIYDPSTSNNRNPKLVRCVRINDGGTKTVSCDISRSVGPSREGTGSTGSWETSQGGQPHPPSASNLAISEVEVEPASSSGTPSSTGGNHTDSSEPSLSDLQVERQAISPQPHASSSSGILSYPLPEIRKVPSGTLMPLRKQPRIKRGFLPSPPSPPLTRSTTKTKTAKKTKVPQQRVNLQPTNPPYNRPKRTRSDCVQSGEVTTESAKAMELDAENSRLRRLTGSSFECSNSNSNLKNTQVRGREIKVASTNPGTEKQLGRQRLPKGSYQLMNEGPPITFGRSLRNVTTFATFQFSLRIFKLTNVESSRLKLLNLNFWNHISPVRRSQQSQKSCPESERMDAEEDKEYKITSTFFVYHEAFQ